MLKKQLKNLSLSPTLAMAELQTKLLGQHKNIYSLGFGENPFPPPQIVQNILKHYAFRTDYMPISGLPSLRKAIAENHNRLYGTNFQDHNVHVGPGSKQMLFLIQFVTQNAVLVPTPCWVSHLNIPKVIDKNYHLIHTSRDNFYKLTAKQIDETVKTTNKKFDFLVLNYPNNPTGQTYSKSELIDIADVCRRNNLLVLSDEIYSCIDFDGNHQSIHQFLPHTSFVTSGISKWMGAGGWRLGYIIIPDQFEEIGKIIDIVASESYSSASSPVQLAAQYAFQNYFGKEIQDFLHMQRFVFKTLNSLICAELEKTEIHFHPAEGGFYLFLDFEAYRDQIERDFGLTSGVHWTEKILEQTGVTLLPGSAFGRDEKELSARLSFVDFDGQKVYNHLINDCEDQTVDIVKQLCHRTIEGVQKLAEFVTKLR